MHSVRSCTHLFRLRHSCPTNTICLFSQAVWTSSRVNLLTWALVRNFFAKIAGGGGLWQRGFVANFLLYGQQWNILRTLRCSLFLYLAQVPIFNQKTFRRRTLDSGSNWVLLFTTSSVLKPTQFFLSAFILLLYVRQLCYWCRQFAFLEVCLRGKALPEGVMQITFNQTAPFFCKAARYALYAFFLFLNFRFSLKPFASIASIQC